MSLSEKLPGSQLNQPGVGPLRQVLPPARSGTARLVLGGLAVGLTALLVAGFTFRDTPPRQLADIQGIRVARVRAGLIESTLRLNGTLAAKDAATLTAPKLSGGRGRGGPGDFSMTLQRLSRAGTIVQRGTVVAEFDRQYMEVRLDDFQAEVRQEEANMRRLRANLDSRMKAHDQRIRVARGAMDKAALDMKSAPVRSLMARERLRLIFEEARARHAQLLEEVKYFEASERAAIRRDELGLEQLQIELKRAELNLDRLKLEAPLDGLVLPQLVRRGRGGQEMAEVAEGDQLQSGQPFLRIVGLRSLVVEASASQTDAERLRLGGKARVKFDALAGLSLPARITGVGAVTSGTRNRPDYVRSIPVRLQLDAMDPRAFPNASVHADVILASAEASAIVPRECVFGSGKPQAYVRSDQGWELRDLVLGMSNHIEVEVVEGLRQGETVAAEKVTAQ